MASRRKRTHAAILADVARANDRIRQQTVRLNALLDHRRAVYVEARDRDDPVPFSRLAEAAGTTEAAVMQVAKKGRNAAEPEGATP